MDTSHVESIVFSVSPKVMPRSKCSRNAQRMKAVNVAVAEKESQYVGSSSHAPSHDENVQYHEKDARSISLPIEVVALIMEELDIAEDHRNLLQSAALVSRVWCQAAQAMIFRSIEVDGRQACQFWSRKFKHSPHLGEYVRQLCLSDPDDDCMGTPYLRTSPAKSLVSALTRLQCLVLEDIMQWGPVEQRLVKRFQTVTDLSVGDIKGMKGSRDLPDLLYALPNVEALRLGTFGPLLNDFRELSAIYEAGAILRSCMPPDSTPRKLRELQLDEADLSIDILMWLTGPAFNLSKLEKFSMTWSDFLPSDDRAEPDFSTHDQLFRLIGGHVTLLDLTIPTPSDYEDSSFHIYHYNPQDYLTAHLVTSRDLANFTALKTISMDVERSGDLLPYLICTCSALLATLAAPHLRYIQLVSGFNARTKHRLEGACGIPQWKSLDDLLSGGFFPSLSSVDFTVYLVGATYWFLLGAGTPVRQDIVAAIQGCLPRTVSKGLLRLNVYE
ncbi:hypothetical protein Moror_16666 [Moniliophthora roreri MCA 2997]|uniref:Uncharacterized protein n=2 Tax=Moniliophthora roreri TaxID=221103 RepID=V2WXE2_MONRO|nr:hypothetical protein Moror_16666 [Moniliophthora roreri MCA 2997]